MSAQPRGIDVSGPAFAGLSEESRERLSRPLPAKHALNYYAVLGALEGIYPMLGYTRDEATEKAVSTLKGCKPMRRRAR